MLTCKAKGTVRDSSYLLLSGCVPSRVLIKLLWQIRLCSARVHAEGHKLTLYWELHVCTSPASNAAPVCWVNRSSGTAAFCESHPGPKLNARDYEDLLCLTGLQMLKNNPVVSGTQVL